MRKSRRLVVPLAVFALLAGGGLAAGLSLVANAQTAITSCTGSSTTPAVISCSISDSSTTYSTTVNAPSSIQAVVTLNTPDTSTTPDQYVVITYSVYCAQGSGDKTTSNLPAPGDQFAIATGAPVTDTLTLGYTNPDFCEVINLAAELESSSDGGTTLSPDTTGSFTMELEWTPAASASSSSPSSVNVSLIKGYGGKCVDDKANSSSNKTEVIIWTCNSGDSAQGWTYTNGELQHNGKCANDQGNGGSGSKVILWSCNGASNETWFHSSSDGEFVLSLSSHGILCLDDPGYSTTNRTQLIVYACHNGSNQHWT